MSNNRILECNELVITTSVVVIHTHTHTHTHTVTAEGENHNFKTNLKQTPITIMVTSIYVTSIYVDSNLLNFVNNIACNLLPQFFD